MDFSIVICTYNSAHMVGDALRSVARQTFRDFELIIVDDGSTDDTARVVKEFESQIMPLRYRLQRHSGTAVSRNAGVAGASGEFIAFLDADDIWSPDYLASMAQALRAHPKAGIAYCNGIRVDASGRALSTIFDEHLPTACGPARTSRELYSFFRAASPSMSVIAKAVFERVGHFDARFPSGGEDWNWMIRAATQGVNLLRLNKKLVVYRVHGENLTAETDKVFEAWLQTHSDPLKGAAMDSEAEGFARRFTHRYIPSLLARYPARKARSLLSLAQKQFPGDGVLRAAFVFTYLHPRALVRFLLALRRPLARLARGGNLAENRALVESICQGSSLQARGKRAQAFRPSVSPSEGPNADRQKSSA